MLLSIHPHNQQLRHAVVGLGDTVTIGTLSIQKSADRYRYGHHAVPIQMMVAVA